METPLACARRVVRRILLLYADDVGLVSTSPERTITARMMTITTVEAFAAVGLIVPGQKGGHAAHASARETTKTIRQPRPPFISAKTCHLSLKKWVRSMPRFASSGISGGLVSEDGELTHEISHRQSAPPWILEVRLMLSADATEDLLHGHMAWAPLRDDYALLRTTNRRLLMRAIAHRRVRRTYRSLLKCAKAHLKTGAQSLCVEGSCVETIIIRQRRHFSREGALATNHTRRGSSRYG